MTHAPLVVRRHRVGLLALLSLGLLGADDPVVTALGRLEPKNGVTRVAGPSHAALVIAELLVEEGDSLEPGQLIARLDSHARMAALVDRAEAELENAQRELRRSTELQRGRAASQSAREEAEVALKVAQANLAAAQADLALSEVRAPAAGRVLAIHTRDGERVGADGILELGQTEEMFAVAEVYETDVGRVRVGQRATITSPALDEPLSGRVERIALMVSKMDVLGIDPIAKTDARVVEVDVRLDPNETAQHLTYMQVFVEIQSSSEP